MSRSDTWAHILFFLFSCGTAASWGSFSVFLPHGSQFCSMLLGCFPFPLFFGMNLHSSTQLWSMTTLWTAPGCFVENSNFIHPSSLDLAPALAQVLTSLPLAQPWQRDIMQYLPVKHPYEELQGLQIEVSLRDRSGTQGRAAVLPTISSYLLLTYFQFFSFFPPQILQQMHTK